MSDSGMTLNPARRILLTALGIVLVAIGVLGIFLPLLPTTIFLLLASACFVKSSPRMNRWLLNNRWLGGYLRNYRQGGGMTKRAKISTVLFLWVSLVISAALTDAGPLVLALLAAVGVGVTVHLAMVKTAPSSAQKDRVEVNSKEETCSQE